MSAVMGRNSPHEEKESVPELRDTDEQHLLQTAAPFLKNPFPNIYVPPVRNQSLQAKL